MKGPVVQSLCNTDHHATVIFVGLSGTSLDFGNVTVNTPSATEALIFSGYLKGIVSI
jgi:hypothetical protein